MILIFFVISSKCLACAKRSFFLSQDIVKMMQSNDMKVDLAVYGMLSLACQSAKDAEKFFRETDEFNVE